MDWTQRHQAAMDEVRPNYGINVDDAMTIPNFSLGKYIWLLVAMIQTRSIKTY